MAAVIPQIPGSASLGLTWKSPALVTGRGVRDETEGIRPSEVPYL
jgi:hypothetical protein